MGPDGRVTLPIVGEIDVAGLTLADAQDQITAAMSAEPLRIFSNDGQENWLNLEPSEILVEISSYSPVFVSGAVGQPGRFDYTPGMTVRQLVATAGGLGMSGLDADTSARQAMDLTAEREVAVERLDSIMAQVGRLREELRSISAEGEPSVPSSDAPGPADEVAPEPGEAPARATEEQDLSSADGALPLVVLNDEVATSAGGDDLLTRPRARPTEQAQVLPAADAEPTLPVAEEPDAQAAEAVAPPAPAPRSSTSDDTDDLEQVGRELVASGVAMRGVDAASARQLIEEMNTRLDLLRRRQAEEEQLVANDRAEVNRVQDLIDRGLVPATESDAAERTLLMSTLQSYDTADMVARLEIDLARMTADLQRLPSESAREILLELEKRLADGEVARAQVSSIDQQLALLGGSAAGQAGIQYDFVLYRGNGDEAVATTVEQDQPLQPGDSLEVVPAMDGNAP
ncbi:hypothetical protein Rumeso_02722 [Rubellimicrobium mesophilum DSM 19309]|uniref:Uncharacterized protein n=1 Tax=Rubellimicrobium mesophilum DSM 19309 TaxID=442562 RepID=A0A017HMV1_9RHOB|nr:hypothetical protein Rumeso_02722 [Rubellimicrobium mesophilum DSM 19309]